MPRNPHLQKLFPWLTPEQERQVELLLWERAAQGFEAGGLWRDAADCWLEAGNAARASALYTQGGDRRTAARVLLERGSYAEALQLYEAWLSALLPGDGLGRVEALLGQATCHLLGAEARADGLSRASGVISYRQALELVKGAGNPQAGRGWRLVAEYGGRVKRYDLVEVGYSRALAGAAMEAERVEVLRAWHAAAESWGDRTLSIRLAEQLAEANAWDEAPRPAWHAERDEIEGRGFRDGARDALHFVSEEQMAAWEKLAAMENEPEVDNYLRGLAPENMVYIPAGSFLMGCPEDEIEQALADYEAAGSPNNPEVLRPLIASARGQHEVWLRGYYMDKYPVTNAQYRRFMEAGGYEKREYWTEAGWQWKGSRTQPEYWGRENYTGDNQPVVGVSWYEAVAYANWAGKALPGEAAWEKAAGWDPAQKQRRKYPWGDEWNEKLCNWDQGKPTPVGQYSPGGDSAYGLADMAGNVYEWCNTRWGTRSESPDYAYPYVASDGREDLTGGNEMFRDMRGGCWNNIQPQKIFQRCGFRNWSNPWLRLISRGFRCIHPTHSLPSES